jgi:AraC family transcriptional regulator
MNIVVIAGKDTHREYQFFDSVIENFCKCCLADYKKVLDLQHPNLVILDCGFKTGDGIALLSEIKTHYISIPVIFITDVGSEEIVLKAFRNGARDFFRKPLNIFQLQETVLGILSVKKGTRESRRPFTNRPFCHRALLKKVTTGQPLSLTRAIRYVDDNLNKEITLDGLAQEASLSKYHFSRLFRKHFGISPMQFVISQKITKAKELLKRKDSTISTVAAEIGFNDLSSFSEQFKKFAGRTPTKFREQLSEVAFSKMPIRPNSRAGLNQIAAKGKF